MNGPDPWLSEYFGNNVSQEEPVDDTIEKMAALRLLEKRAAEVGEDLSQYTPEEIWEAAEAMVGGQEKVASEDDDLEQYFELNKFGGQVQAHAFVNEIRNIAEQEKLAGPRWDAVKNVPGRAWEAIKDAPGSIRRGERRVSEAIGSRLTRQKKLDETQQAAMDAFMEGKRKTTKNINKALDVGIEAGDALARRRGRIAAGIGAGALATGGVGGGIYLARRKGQEKKGSAVEQLIAERQYEILKEAGYVDAYGNIYAPEQEKTAYDETMEEIDQIALQGLIDAGYR